MGAFVNTLAYLCLRLYPLGDGWGIAFGLVGDVFRENLWKSMFLRFRCHSNAELLLLQVRASKLELFFVTPYQLELNPCTDESATN